MKKILIVLFMIFTQKAFSICSVPISRTNINPGQIPTSTAYNNDFDNLYTRSNNVPGDCFADGSVRAKQIEDAALGSTHFADGAVTAAKFASGVIPTMGKPLRVRAFTSSGTWVKQADVESIIVHVVGGGGATGSGTATAGSASSFGSHCVANGGAAANDNSSSTRSAGGTASNGDINLQGGSGERGFLEPTPRGGRSLLGSFGQGGEDIQANGGGGAGGYCSKLIQKDSLADNVTVTVGAGGVKGATNGAPGKKGIVLVYEYGE